MKGEVVTLVTMMGEIVGRLKEETTDGYVLEDPRLFVPTQGEGQGQSGGFAPGVSMTGKQELKEGHFNRAVVLTCIPAHEVIESGWREVVSGIITP